MACVTTSFWRFDTFWFDFMAEVDTRNRYGTFEAILRIKTGIKGVLIG
ncbi:hypothetical protein HMPREF3214_01469 [Alloscardovia omnicolens]|nr:hypothetical protein HMPREF3214_01469 [Alloscardovia omnicolens]